MKDKDSPRHDRRRPTQDVSRASGDEAAMTTPAPVFGDLHLLTVLGQTRSYTRTAAWLGMSKATVSQRIAALERAVGVPLVQRSTRAVALTAAGQQLCDETAPSFGQITRSYAAVRDLASSPRGLVRVSAPVALGRQRIMPALAPFLLAYPQIRVELDLNDRMVNLAQEGFDLAIRHTQQPPDTHVAWTLCETQSRLYASPDYLARHGTPTHPAELTQHACLVYLRDSASTQRWTLVRPRRRQPPEQVGVQVYGPLKTNNSELLREGALAGLGIAILPDFSAEGREAGDTRPTLVNVLPQWQAQGVFGSRILAIRPWAPQVPKAVRHLVEHLRDSL